MRKILLILVIGYLWSCQKADEAGFYQTSSPAAQPALTTSTPVNLERPALQKLINGIVYLEYTFYDRGVKETNSCNGVVIAPFKILTAAHCFFTKEILVNNEGHKFIPDKNGLILQYGDVVANSPLMKKISGQQIVSIELHKNFFSDQSRKKRTPKSAIFNAALNSSDQAIITLDYNLLINTVHFNNFKEVPHHYQLDDGTIDKKNTDNFKYSLMLAYTSYIDLNPSALDMPRLYFVVGQTPSASHEPQAFESGVLIEEIESKRHKGSPIGTCFGDSGSPIFYELKNSDKLLLVGILSGGIPETSSGPHCSFKSIFSLILNNRNWLGY